MARISVIITHYSDSFLYDALESILKQTYKDLDIYILDDSTEGVEWLSKISPLLNKEKVNVLKSNRNVGTYRLKNKIISTIDSEFIAFQDSDDISMPRRLEEQYNIIVNNKKLGLIGTSYYEVDNMNGVVLKKAYRNLWLRFRLGMKCNCLHPTWLIRRSLFDDLGGFDGTTRIGADDDFYYRSLYHSRATNMQNPLYKKRVHNNSLTQSTDTGFYSKLRLDYRCKIENKMEMLRRAKRSELKNLLVAEPNNEEFEFGRLF